MVYLCFVFDGAERARYQAWPVEHRGEKALSALRLVCQID